ncbi:MAG: SRPBCC family protein [Bryobacterales bacterium]|nr:SRPBCC family protein [Bryobacterales bacterium]
MQNFQISFDIQAPPERVWAIMRDFARWHEWTPTVTSIQPVDPGAPVAPGMKVLIRQPRFPPAVWELLEIAEGRRFHWATRSPGVEVIARHGVEPAARGTRATLSLEFRGLLGGVVGWLTRGINQRYLKTEAEGLTRRAETPPAY